MIPDIMDCPGAWYGWQPKHHEAGQQGHIIVDPEKIVAALAWLRKGFHIGSTKLTLDKGISIQLAIRYGRYSKPPQDWKPHQTVTT